MGQPAVKGHSNCRLCVGVGDWELRRFPFVIPDAWGWLFFEGWLMQLSPQYKLHFTAKMPQIKHLLLASGFFFSIFEMTFCKYFHKQRDNLWIFLGGEVIVSSSMASFHYETPWYQFCLMKLNPLLTRNYAIKSSTSSSGGNKSLPLVLLKPWLLIALCVVCMYEYVWSLWVS